MTCYEIRAVAADSMLLHYISFIYLFPHLLYPFGGMICRVSNYLLTIVV